MVARYNRPHHVGTTMETKLMDLRGLKCPQPTLKMTIELRLGLANIDAIEVLADCPTFENDLKSWCDRNKRTVLWLRDEGNGVKRCQVRL